MSIDPDSHRMLRFQNGDEAAFQELFHNNKTRIFRFAFRYFNDADLAEEYTQETFLRIYQAKETYKPLAAFTTWAFGITAQLCLNALRSRRRHVSLDAALSDDGTSYDPKDDTSPSNEESFVQKEISAAVAAAIQELPATQRALVLMTYYDNFSIAEAAQALGITAISGRLRLFRARIQLKKKLRRYA